ncbi:hypothetical protein BKA69DRAFT_1026374 [Paraphysoderma sedebokerense]|nr:hypothetical protein BKA69DRAFT_1026374 [Paraphysoderma sedebokerense]
METPEGSNETGVPFTCTICDKSFWRKYDFKRHVRIHTNERPYVCPRCEKGFTRKVSSKDIGYCFFAGY